MKKRFLAFFAVLVSLFSTIISAYAQIPCVCDNPPDQCTCFIQLGDKGYAVERIIARLKKIGYLKKSVKKTEFSPEVKQTELQFQKDNNLEFMANDSASLSHTKWNCKYHIVFAPKYRRQEIYGKIKADIGQILRKLCEAKRVEILEAEACPDHIHMLVSIPPNISVSQLMGYLKGKSSLMIFDRNANLKYKYGNRHFWCRGYYVDTVGRNKEKITEYIRNQLQEDITYDQLSFKEYIDPFTGSKNTRA